jgi:opacity protein-like surface antigen
MTAAEWIFAVYLGTAHTQSAALAFSAPQVTFASVDFRAESWRPPLYYGYRVAFFPRQQSWLGVEAEFTHLKAYAVLPDRATVQRFSMSHGLNFVVVNIAARRTLHASDRGALRLTARAGVGPTVPHVESTIAGVPEEGYQAGSMALHVGGGIEIPVRRHVTVIAEYKLTRVHEQVDAAAGHVQGLFVSHHAIAGVAWHTR